MRRSAPGACSTRVHTDMVSRLAPATRYAPLCPGGTMRCPRSQLIDRAKRARDGVRDGDVQGADGQGERSCADIRA
jgi:hypothetical protein